MRHEDLPWPGLIHDLSTRGRTNALQAAMLVKPMPTVRGRRYTATGWREIDGKSVFVHAAGGIGCDGDVELPHISITGKLGVFQMPKPTQDVAVLRDAVRDGLAPLIHLPASIVAPLIGFAFRSVFGNPRTSLHLVGEPGSGKTSITRCAGLDGQPLAPGLGEIFVSEQVLLGHRARLTPPASRQHPGPDIYPGTGERGQLW